MPEIRIYSRPGCHLCELLLEEIGPLARGRATLDVIDVDSRADLRAEYGTRVPVVEIDGRRVCQYKLDRQAVSAALDRSPE